MLAKKSALSIKVASTSFKVIDKFDLSTYKTKETVSFLDKLELNNEKIILITESNNSNLYLSSRNLEKINLVNVNSLSIYDIMNSSYLLVDMKSIEFLNNLNN